MVDSKVLIWNGNLTTAADIRIPAEDLALLRGYGVFDFFLMYDGLPLFFEDHWQRLRASATAMHLSIPFTREALLDMLQVLYSHMPCAAAGARVTLTGGASPDGYSIAHMPNYLITLQPLPPLPGTLPQNTISLMLCEYRRAFPQVKTIDYTMGIMMQPIARQNGFDDVLYVQQGEISECPRSNIFAVSPAGTLHTPASGILYGITRSRILRHARRIMPVEEGILTIEMLQQASEVFISSTSKGIWPVSRVGETHFNNGMPGPVASRLYGMLVAELPSE